jgi:hypothetical protein
MHQHVTHNRCYATYNDFCRSVLKFLRVEVPKNWAIFCDPVTDNFRVINPADFRVLKAWGYTRTSATAATSGPISGWTVRRRWQLLLHRHNGLQGQRG